MPEYVYALHDFLPEHEDEVSFHAGERIEVVEKDDLYGDGWWQGRNLAGKVGLFPQSYTAPAPPASSTAILPSSAEDANSPLHPLPEESESVDSATRPSTNGHRSEPSGDGEVMKATMTDVQKAIEQLGRNDRDGSRSFSFASTRDGDTTDRETDTDLDTDREMDGDDWHKEARIKLAEQSRKVVEAAREKEVQEQEQMRSVAPPIEVELSDESEGEEDHEDALHHYQASRAHPYIPEEDERDVESVSRPDADADDTAGPGEIEVPAPEQPEALATARRTSFPPIKPPTPHQDVFSQEPEPASLPTPTSPTSPLPVTSVEYVVPYPSVADSIDKPSSMVTTTPSNVTAVALPSPAASSTGFHIRDASKHSSIASSTKVSATSDPVLKKPTVHPSEWSVEEVVDWLNSKGFQDVVDKFVEQEITGDVLLELDVNLLKTEIGIIAFGKRMRIANAITDLRRPPSINYSDTQSPLPISHSHIQSPSYSYSHSHSHSIQSSTQHSLNSPLPGSSGFTAIVSPESPPHTGDLAGSPLPREARRVSDPGSVAALSMNVNDDNKGIAGGLERAAMIGLGLGSPSVMNGKGFNRPAQLQLSPSDSALRTKAISGDIPEEGDERAAMSENEVPATKQRRRMFGRSNGSEPSSKAEKRESTNSKGSRSSKEVPSPHSNANLSPTSEGTKLKRSEEGSISSRHSRRKGSIDAAKASDRLSLFGGTFGSGIGKSRKPPPRYSTYGEPAEKTSHLNLARLYGGSSSRKSSGRPSTSDGEKSSFLKEKQEKESPKAKEVKESKEKESKNKETSKEARDPALLRKRTSSNGSDLPRGVGGNWKPGQSILQQIGQSDHNGWMRKKGERYNTWKLRYFVLKGQHLYYLRSNSKSETKIKGYINILGYKVVADENVNPGRYGFRIVHDTDKTHYFSSEEQIVVREWMKAVMKATIGRDYTKPVVSSCNIPTIPLTVAQAMNPAPRPPSPSQRAATQKSFRRENPNQLSTRDARILMGLPSPEGITEDAQETERVRLESFFTNETVPSQDGVGTPGSSTPKSKGPVPPRPSREMRRMSSNPLEAAGADAGLFEWANSHLPPTLKITDPTGSLCGGLALLRLAESIKGKPSSPPVPDSAFPSGPNDDKLDGLFRLFDFLLDNDVKMGSVSINDVRQGKRDKIVQLLKALRAWEEKRRAIVQSIGKGSVQAGAFVAPVGMPWGSM